MSNTKWTLIFAIFILYSGKTFRIFAYSQKRNKLLLSGVTVTLDTNNAAKLTEQQLAWVMTQANDKDQVN